MRFIIKPTVKEVFLPIKPKFMTADKDIEFACTLPDYAPDVSLIVRAGCKPAVKSANVGAGKCTVEGVACFELTYITGDGKIKSAKFAKDFSQTFEVSTEITDAASIARASATYVGCKLQDSRSPTFKAVIKTDVELTGNAVVRMLDADDSGDACCKTGNISFKRRSLPETVQTEISGDIILGRADMAASEVISHSVLLPPPRIMQNQNGLALRSDAAITIIYEGEKQGSGYISVTRTLPISVEVSGTDMSDEAKCSMLVLASSVTLMPDNYGENRVFRVKMTVRSSWTNYKTEKLQTVTDMFTPHFVTQYDTAKASVPVSEAVVSKTFTVETRFEPDTPFDDIFSAEAEFCGISAVKESSGTRLFGSVQVSVLGRQGEKYGSLLHSQSLDQLLSIDCGDSEIIRCDVAVIDLQPTLLSSGDMTVRITAEASVCLYKSSEITFVSDIAKETAVVPDGSGMTAAYYFPSATDDLWSIAKSYAVAPSTIASLNDGAFDQNGALTGTVPFLYIIL